MKSCSIERQIKGLPDVEKGFDKTTCSHLTTNWTSATEVNCTDTAPVRNNDSEVREKVNSDKPGDTRREAGDTNFEDRLV
jgi:hypothetical protein